MARAIVYRKTGPPSVLEYVKDWVVPARKQGEVRVAMKSTSFNPVDGKVRAGGRPVTLPKVPGGDCAGLVVEADSNSKYKTNEAVMAFTKAAFGEDPNGTWSEYVNVPEDWLARVPSNLSLDEEAGAVPLVTLTAFQALETCDLKPGARVLVHAGSGGVGHVAVQLAKNYYEAYVVSTSRHVDFVKSIGADEVVDYTKEDFADKYKAQPFDAIVDLIGGDTELKSYGIIKENGTFAQISNTGSDPKRVEAGKKWTDKKYTSTRVVPNGKQLSVVAQLIADENLKIHVSDVIPLEKAREAEELASKKEFGKIVIKI